MSGPLPFEWISQSFESEHLGVTAARIANYQSTEDAADRLSQTLGDMRNAGVTFVSVRVPNTIDASVLRQAGAVEIERLVTLECSLPQQGLKMPTGVRLATPNDAGGCAEVGLKAFTFDRFHRDPHFSRTRADALKSDWMRNACLGRADAVFVSISDGQILGANACLLRDGIATIDLIGVLPVAQGKGLGRKLVEASIAYYGNRAKALRVGTQTENIVSVALYRATGFKPVNEQVTLHLHLGNLP